MNEKIQVLGLGIDNLTAKEAVKRVVSYMETEPVNVVEMVTMNTLGKFQQDETAKELFERFDIALASDKGILEAAGVTDERRLREVDELLFIKMVMRFLHKNSTRVFLLAEDVADLQKLQMYMQEDYSNVQVVGTATMEENAASDDMLLNLVNGAEAECILSALPSPVEEQFIFRNHALVNARVWLGFGNLLDELKKEKTGFMKVKEFIIRQFLKKEMAKKGENA
ncbi:MAG: WecB/TagA/CpsF family glycosyltransferase [Lachnospiraceae bacterium]|nr:WecB/TagA/CpsF family glycosyltransferase [Lachnospiraceae bacterium]